MTEITTDVKPYEKAYFAPKPTFWVTFFRRNIIYQFIRFCIINFKMVKVIFKSHH